MSMKTYKFLVKMWDSEAKTYGVATWTVEAANPASAWNKIPGAMSKEVLASVDSISLISVD